MYEDDVFGDWLLDQFYGFYVWLDLKVGQIVINIYIFFVGICEVKICFKGKGGYAVFLYEVNDVLVAVSYFVI